MSAYSAEEQALLDWLKSSIPRWLWMDDKAQEVWAATVKSLAVVQAQIEDWNRATFILTATDIWLNQHAKDRGTLRQGSESDPALQNRIRSPQDALTRQSLIDAVNLILAGEGIAGTAYMVELPRDSASCGTYISDTGTGGTFTLVDGPSNTWSFTPTVPFAMPPFVDPTLTRQIAGYKLVISGAANVGNNGTFAVTKLVGAGAAYVNATAVAGFDGTLTWATQKLDRQGNVMDGHGKAFCSRGFRASKAGRPQSIVIILPYGSTASTVSSVAAMLRLKKAAGFNTIVEQRLSP